MTDKTDMRDYWDEIGSSDRANWHIAHIDDEDSFFASGSRSCDAIFEGQVDSLKPHSLVLDIGCGKGRVARALATARQDLRVIGVDVAPSMIARAIDINQRIPNLFFFVGDGISLSAFPDRTFDYIYSYIVFQHLPRHITAQYISDAARVLKPGGKLIFQVQQREAPNPIDPPWNDFRQIRFYTADQAAALVLHPLALEKTRGGGHNFFVNAIRIEG